MPGTEAELDAALAYIAARDEVWEVVVTGGDPLVLSPRRLSVRLPCPSGPTTSRRKQKRQ
jgi:L-lysine 2,3-aminomutase